jgi:hypothetical protein
MDMAGLPRATFSEMVGALDDIVRFERDRLHHIESQALRYGLEPEPDIALGGMRIMIERVAAAKRALVSLVPLEGELRQRLGEIC